ncbi:MAG TPA: septum formation initiator family protein [Elusimicrobiales bacterium]|nr:septum formation initiator family protein [Elusimicrobiales bacterium]
MRQKDAVITRRTGLTLLALAAAVLLLANPGFRSLVANKIEVFKMKRRLAALKAESAELKSAAAETARSESVEYNARRELGMLRQGEIEFRFPPPPEKERDK